MKDIKNLSPEDRKIVEENYKQSIDNLQDNINGLLNELEEPIENMLPGSDTLPSFNIGVSEHDYDSDLESIKVDAKETLKCLANLYLDKKSMKNKNISNIIKNDSSQLADLNFTISCARRALMSCMMQLDYGVNDPEMYKSVALFQKEMRDTIKMANELQKKMKEFYKELSAELADLNKGEEVPGESDNSLEAPEEEQLNLIGDPRKLNDLLEIYKDDPTLLKQKKSEPESQVE